MEPSAFQCGSKTYVTDRFVCNGRCEFSDEQIDLFADISTQEAKLNGVYVLSELSTVAMRYSVLTGRRFLLQIRHLLADPVWMFLTFVT